jgi:hypothetical protein
MNLTYTQYYNNVTNPADIVFGMNQSVGGILGVTILMTCWIILVIVLVNNGNSFKTSFASGTFVGLILAWILWLLNLIGERWFYFFLIMMSLAIISMFVREQG